MTKRGVLTRVDRRSFLAGAAATCAATLAAAAENDDPLQELIERNQQGEVGQGFDAAANKAQMPKLSLPTLSPATTQTTEQAVAQYEAIVARGGWPTCPPAAGCGSASSTPA